MKTKVIIPISGISRVVAQSLAYAQGISNDIIVVTVAVDDEQDGKISSKWEEWNVGLPLVILRSPYRSLFDPLLKYIDSLEKSDPNSFVTVLIPQFIVKKWWHAFLHNQTAVVLRTVLLLRKDVVVTTIPFHLRH